MNPIDERSGPLGQGNRRPNGLTNHLQAYRIGGQDQGDDAAEWRAIATQAIVELAGGPTDFTSDDVSARAGKPLQYHQLGGVLSGAVRRGEIRATGALVTGDGRMIRVFRGCLR